MNLVIDTSVLVGELFRVRGVELLTMPTVTFFQPEYAVGESRHELQRRVNYLVQRGQYSTELGKTILERGLQLMTDQIQILPAHAYAPFEPQARRRIPRDPNDWAFVAAGLYLNGAGILTRDGDFLGCGLPTWTPDTLRAEWGL